MDFTHPPVFQRQVSQNLEHVFSTSFDAVDVMKKRLKQSGHPNGMPIHFALQRNVYEANDTNLPIGLEQARLSNAKDMHIEAKANSSREQHSLYFMSQDTSWSCLNVSLSSFHNIVNVHNFSDNVYDVVQAFRSRKSEIQQFRWSACRTRLSSPESDCYVPSTQQSQSRRSIFYAPDRSLSEKRWTAKLDVDNFAAELREEDPMSLHLIFLYFQSTNWDDFVEHLRISIEPLVDAAHFSRVGRSCKYPLSDYSVEFIHCQNLQKFQWKLTQILPAIDGNIAVLKTCQERWLENRNGPRIQASIADVRGFVKELEFHKESIQKLADQAQRSTEMLNKILDFRSSQEMQKTHTEMYNTLGTLDSQAKTLRRLSEQREKDSKAMRALTSVATFYLPASLVAAIFSSSNLVQVLPNTSLQESRHFVAGPQTWLPVAATLSLLAMTLVFIWILERGYRHFK
ncbi:hypothetical protein MMC29_000093 [Sticta canariensis]|nr:hypothetical protein [Sticta canariensis]